MSRQLVNCLSAVFLLLPLTFVWADEVDDLYERAVNYHAEDEVESAIIELKNALQLNTRHIPARLLLGRALLENNLPVAAENQLQQARDLGADPNLVMPLLGNSWLIMGEPEKVLEFSGYGTLETAQQSEWVTLRARAMLMVKEYTLAHKEFSRAGELAPDSAAPFAGRAAVYLVEQNYAEAEAYVDKALKMSPNDDVALKLKGDSLNAFGKQREALAYFDRAIAENPRNWDARQSRVSTLVSLGELDQALVEVDGILDITPSNASAMFFKALILTRQKDDRAAQDLLHDLDLALSEIPNDKLEEDYSLQLVRATTLYMQGKPAQALPYVEKINAQRPEKAFVRQMLTNIYFQAGNYQKIVDLYLGLETLAPNDAPYVYQYAKAGWSIGADSEVELKLRGWSQTHPELMEHLGQLLAITLFSRDKNEEALGVLDDIEPEKASEVSINSLLLLGNIQIEQSFMEGAEMTADRLVVHFPFDERAYNYACLVQKRLGNFDEAIELCRQAIELNEQYVPAVINLSLVYMERGDYPQAASGLAAVVKVFPSNANALAGLVYIAEQTGDYKNAARLTERLVSFYPKDINYRLQMARLQLQLGKTASAMDLLDVVDRLSPLNPQAVSLRASALSQLGKTEEAAKQLLYLQGHYSENPEGLVAVTRQQIAITAVADAARSIDMLEEFPAFSSEAKTLRGQLYLMNRQYEDCTAIFTGIPSALRTVGQSILLSECYLAVNSPGEALAALDQIPPEASTVDIAVRRFRLKSGKNPEQAIAQAEAYVQLHSGALEVERAVADYFLAANPDEAIARYEAILERHGDEDNADVSNNLANLYLSERGDLKQALGYARRAYEVQPDNPLIADTYGWVLVRSEQPQEGLRYLREAYVRNARHPEIKYHLAMALSELGQLEEARRYAEAIPVNSLSAEQQAQLADALQP